MLVMVRKGMVASGLCILIPVLGLVVVPAVPAQAASRPVSVDVAQRYMDFLAHGVTAARAVRVARECLQ